MTSRTVIKVLGLGGAGSNAVNHMIPVGIEGVEFIAANTDMQDLAKSEAPKRLLLGEHVTRGLGAGGLPHKGEAAAEESANQISEALKGADIVFIAAGMGGGTGTGAAPVAARLARQSGALTVAVVSTPFAFEGKRRWENAQLGLQKLEAQCNSVIRIANDKLLYILPRAITFDMALRAADDVLRQGIQGIAELVTRPGLINVDFSNIRSLMELQGGACLSIGQGRGANKAIEAVQEALNNKLLESNTLQSAGGVLAHFTGGDDLTLFEIDEAMKFLNAGAGPDAQVVLGATLDESMTGRAQVILVATGVTPSQLRPVSAPRQPEPQAETALAGALFANVQPPATRAVEWVVAADPQPDPEPESSPLVMSPDNLDIPAFMRRRRLYAAK